MSTSWFDDFFTWLDNYGGELGGFLSTVGRLTVDGVQLLTLAVPLFFTSVLSIVFLIRLVKGVRDLI